MSPGAQLTGDTAGRFAPADCKRRAIVTATRLGRAIVAAACVASTAAVSQALAQQLPGGANLNVSDTDALAAQAQFQSEILATPGVQGVGVGFMADGVRQGIHLFVRRGTPLTSLPTRLGNVPVRVIESPGFTAHNGPCDANAPCHAGAYAKPVPMGVSTGNVNGYFAGTLGFRVHRSGNPNEVGYLTNNHIAAATGDLCPAQVNPARLVAFGTNECQPGLFDSIDGTCALSRRIGRLVQVTPLVMGGSFLNVADAAFVQSKRGCVSKNILDIGAPSANAQFPAIGDVVTMSGRTSGRKINKVLTINAVVDVAYESVCGTARFVNQAISIPVDSDAASLPGDSGAPVLKILGSSRIPTGLNFAGDGYMSVITPIPIVLNALGVEIDTNADAAPAASCL
jgi:hypothetical protein